MSNNTSIGRANGVKKLISGAFALGLSCTSLLVMPSVAEANCVVQGKVNRLNVGAGANVVDIAPLTAVPTFNAFFPGVTPTFSIPLAAAQAAGEVVIVTGNAASCPTVGTFRNGGNVIAVDIKTFIGP